MIVCICRAVSDRAIRAARDAGAASVEAVGAATGAGTCCGCCRGSIARILAEPCRAPCVAVQDREDTSAETVPLRAAADRLKTP
ncbi:MULTISPECIES: bacterioferritin-associated ferredoxin [Anaeromyxobacter]|uniref:(2Fe-2S)-binding protein n=1 Tax=Anaeromyxobacter TaxID=161492 RepID=UPI001F5AA58C|nr:MULTISPECIES: (2Fe-2S)-binding protein [unclassified Anaeromyxobacter]